LTPHRWNRLAFAAAALATLCCLAGARAQAGAPATAIDPKLSPSEAVAAAIPAGQIDRAIANLDGLARDILRRTGVPGMAVAVVRGGKTVYAKGFGVRRIGAPERVDADTVFQIASLSKSVGATVVAHEVGLHVVDWVTPIVQHLPWFALGDDWITKHVTIADMYAHRSGLPDHAGDDLEDIGFDQRQILERLRFLPLHSFRNVYDYTNFGVTAAAEAVAAAAGTDWATLSDQAIYAPLGMTSTSSRFADFEQRTNRAVGHVRNPAGKFEVKYQRQPDAQSPAGGVSSSARDMARWMSMVLQGGVYDGKPIVDAGALLPAVTAEIISGHSATMTERASMYGYGFGVGTQPSGRTSISHSGGFDMGAATNYVIIPSVGVGIVVLSNAQPIGAVEALGATFADLVQFGSVTRNWLAAYGGRMEPMLVPFGTLYGKAAPEHPAPAASLQSYVGDFASDYGGDANVVQSGDGLALKLGPAQTEYALRHWDGNVFVYTPTGENAPDGSVSKATFTMDAAGRAASLVIEYFAASGRGDFIRR
jgi:CubicO group peptidase (beta-lactamase class C family)